MHVATALASSMYHYAIAVLYVAEYAYDSRCPYLSEEHPRLVFWEPPPVFRDLLHQVVKQVPASDQIQHKKELRVGLKGHVTALQEGGRRQLRHDPNFQLQPLPVTAPRYLMINSSIREKIELSCYLKIVAIAY